MNEDKSGDEGPLLYGTVNSPVSSLLSDDSREPALGFFPAFISTSNSIFATGLLIMPWVFAQVGDAVSALGVAVQAFFSCISMLLLVETLARADAIRRVHSILSSGDIFIRGNVLCSVGDEVMTLNHVCRLFCGRWAAAMWNLGSIAISCFTMMFYATVWAQTMTDLWGIPETFSVRIYALLVLGGLAAMQMSVGIASQLKCQIALAVLATLSFIVLISASLFDNEDYLGPVSFVESHKLHLLLSYVMLAFTNHHHASSLTRILRNKNTASALYISAFAAVCALYVLFALFFSYWFGSTTKIPFSANHAYTHLSATVRYLIQIVCLLNITSAMPFQATTAGNVLLECLPKVWALRVPRRLPRIFSAFACLCGSYFVRDMTSVLQWGGCFCIAFVFVAVPCFHIWACHVSIHVMGGREHPYAGWFGRPFFTGFLIVYGVFALLWNIPAVSDEMNT
jgi:hypothetical protein